MTGSQPPQPPEVPARHVSYRRVILMLALGGPVLAIGGCALFLRYLNFGGASSSSDSLSLLGAIIFIAGCVAFLIGGVWTLARRGGRPANRGR